jgi:signal-transduction protein with cAMP-binding, CBS, and nucleotidyltransferase domain
MTILECCRAEVISAPPEAKVSEIATLMAESNVGSVVITTDDCPVGIVTDRDLVCRVMAIGKDPKKTQVSEVMSTDPVVVLDETGLYEALQIISREGVRRLPIIDCDGLLIGIITLDDIIRLLGQEMQCMGEVIRESTPAT